MAGKRKTMKAAKPAAAAAAGAKPKFGSPAWNAKYGVKQFGGKKKGGK